MICVLAILAFSTYAWGTVLPPPSDGKGCDAKAGMQCGKAEKSTCEQPKAERPRRISLHEDRDAVSDDDPAGDCGKCPKAGECEKSKAGTPRCEKTGKGEKACPMGKECDMGKCDGPAREKMCACPCACCEKMCRGGKPSQDDEECGLILGDDQECKIILKLGEDFPMEMFLSEGEDEDDGPARITVTAVGSDGPLGGKMGKCEKACPKGKQCGQGKCDGERCGKTGKGAGDGSRCEKMGKARCDEPCCRMKGRGEKACPMDRECGKGECDGSRCEKMGKARCDEPCCRMKGRGEKACPMDRECGKGECDGPRCEKMGRGENPRCEKHRHGDGMGRCEMRRGDCCCCCHGGRAMHRHASRCDRPCCGERGERGRMHRGEWRRGYDGCGRSCEREDRDRRGW